ncbi:glutathione S-transferase 1-like [Littorina saxatilis]|uniref:Uncharacterized protein n=1 Tax=Littorina saxatilis TaxID=31220 RepID=A0AAN9G436_9CAEN
MSGIKVHYFDFRGRGEIVRLVLALAGQDFEDVRLSREEWAAKYKSAAPFGQMPYVEYKGKKYGQSKAISAFFANEFGLYGKSNLDRLRIDEVVFLVEDLFMIIVKAFLEQDDTKKAELVKKAVDDEFPKFCGFFCRLLRENSPKGVFVGREVTLADLCVHDLMYTILKTHQYDAAAKYPELQALKEKVEAHPRLQTYLANRKETPF